MRFSCICQNRNMKDFVVKGVAPMSSSVRLWNVFLTCLNCRYSHLLHYLCLGETNYCLDVPCWSLLPLVNV